jgi:hypothetical protein
MTGDSIYEAFDVYFLTFFPPKSTVLQLRLHAHPGLQGWRKSQLFKGSEASISHRASSFSDAF